MLVKMMVAWKPLMMLFWQSKSGVMRDDSSLVSYLLKAKYYPYCNILDDELGRKPSFTWRSLWGARDVIKRGLRWIVGNGESIDVSTNGWIPRSSTFRIVSPCLTNLSNMKVRDLIDADNGCWREALVKEVFLGCDYEVILKPPLCTSWPLIAWSGILAPKGSLLFDPPTMLFMLFGSGMEGALLLAIMTSGNPFGRWMFPTGAAVWAEGVQRHPTG